MSYASGPDTTITSGADRVNTQQVTALRSQLFTVTGFNYGADTYIQIHDVAAAPAAGTRCAFMFFVATGQNFSIDLGSGQVFNNGIFIASCPGATDGLYAASTNDPADLQLASAIRRLRTS